MLQTDVSLFFAVFAASGVVFQSIAFCFLVFFQLVFFYVTSNTLETWSDKEIAFTMNILAIQINTCDR